MSVCACLCTLLIHERLRTQNEHSLKYLSAINKPKLISAVPSVWWIFFLFRWKSMRFMRSREREAKIWFRNKNRKWLEKMLEIHNMETDAIRWKKCKISAHFFLLRLKRSHSTIARWCPAIVIWMNGWAGFSETKRFQFSQICFTEFLCWSSKKIIYSLRNHLIAACRCRHCSANKNCCKQIGTVRSC